MLDDWNGLRTQAGSLHRVVAIDPGDMRHGVGPGRIVLALRPRLSRSFPSFERRDAGRVLQSRHPRQQRCPLQRFTSHDRDARGLTLLTPWTP